MIGRTLSRYKVLSRLGGGGMGEVYVAEDSRLKRKVALKVLPSEVANDTERRVRFEREAQTVAALNHPNIVTIHSVEEDDGVHFITMELIEGKTLRALLPESGLPLSRIFELAMPLADAVSAAHRGGITHRDLKPDNIMVDSEGRLRVLDFGLAKARPVPSADTSDSQAATASVTEAGKILGTVAYMSPEQAEGKAIDARSDIFSIGTILYEMATGKKPFRGDTPISTITAILRDEPQTASDVNPALPRHLGRIIARCISKDPDRRYQTALDVRNELERLKREIDSGELAPGSSVSVAGVPAAGPAPSGRLFKIAGGAVVVAIVLSGIAYWLSGRDGSRSAVTATPPAAEKTGPVGVIGFENLSDPADPEHIGRMLMGLVTTHLSEAGGLRVASTSKVLSAIREAGGGEQGGFESARATEFARAAGVGIMIVGQVARVADRMILTAELVDVDGGDSLGSIRKEAASSAELFTLAGAIAEDVRSQLGTDTLSRAESFDLARALTDSPEAYRHYVTGESMMNVAKWTEAAAAFRRATQEDPSFALAYYRHATALWWNNRVEEGGQVIRDGLPHIARLPEHWREIYLGMSELLGDESDSACERFARVSEIATGIPDAYYLIGECHTHNGALFDPTLAARAFEAALEIDPTFEITLIHLLDAYVVMNDWDAADKLLSEHYIDGVHDPNLDYGRFQIRLARGELDEAISIAEKIEETDIGWRVLSEGYRHAGRHEDAQGVLDRMARPREVLPPDYFGLRAALRIDRGELRDGRSDLEETARRYRGSGMSFVVREAASFLTSLAFLEWATGDLDAAIERGRESLDVTPHHYPGYHALARLLIASGDIDGARATLADLEALPVPIDVPHVRYWSALVRAELHLADGDPKRAASALEEIASVPTQYRKMYEESSLRGRIATAAGNPALAAEEFRKALASTTTWTIFSYSPPVAAQVLTRYDLARAQEQAGDVGGARESYERFLRHWGNADLPIPQVADARARLASL